MGLGIMFQMGIALSLFPPLWSSPGFLNESAILGSANQSES